jgi:hypothetical protein
MADGEHTLGAGTGVGAQGGWSQPNDVRRSRDAGSEAFPSAASTKALALASVLMPMVVLHK